MCTTELGGVAKFIDEFKKKGVKVAAVSCNDSETHNEWIPDIEAFTPGIKVGGHGPTLKALCCTALRTWPPIPHSLPLTINL